MDSDDKLREHDERIRTLEVGAGVIGVQMSTLMASMSEVAGSTRWLVKLILGSIITLALAAVFKQQAGL